MLPSFHTEEYDASAKEILTIGSTATTFTAATIVNCKAAFMTVESASIRIWMDGSTPTATEGHLISDGDPFVVRGVNNLRNFKAIRVTGTDATVMVTYYK